MGCSCHMYRNILDEYKKDIKRKNFASWIGHSFLKTNVVDTNKISAYSRKPHIPFEMLLGQLKECLPSENSFKNIDIHSFLGPGPRRAFRGLGANLQHAARLCDHAFEIC